MKNRFDSWQRLDTKLIELQRDKPLAYYLLVVGIAGLFSTIVILILHTWW